MTDWLSGYSWLHERLSLSTVICLKRCHFFHITGELVSLKFSYSILSMIWHSTEAIPAMFNFLFAFRLLSRPLRLLLFSIIEWLRWRHSLVNCRMYTTLNLSWLLVFEMQHLHLHRLWLLLLLEIELSWLHYLLTDLLALELLLAWLNRVGPWRKSTASMQVLVIMSRFGT